MSPPSPLGTITVDHKQPPPPILSIVHGALSLAPVNYSISVSESVAEASDNNWNWDGHVAANYTWSEAARQTIGLFSNWFGGRSMLSPPAATTEITTRTSLIGWWLIFIVSVDITWMTLAITYDEHGSPDLLDGWGLGDSVCMLQAKRHPNYQLNHRNTSWVCSCADRTLVISGELWCSKRNMNRRIECPGDSFFISRARDNRKRE